MIVEIEVTIGQLVAPIASVDLEHVAPELGLQRLPGYVGDRHPAFPRRQRRIEGEDAQGPVERVGGLSLVGLSLDGPRDRVADRVIATFPGLRRKGGHDDYP